MTKKPTNSFFKSLEGNIKAASHDALVKSVVADANQTIGQIIDSLTEQEEAVFLLDAFKEMSIGEIVQGAVDLAQSRQRAAMGAPASAPQATVEVSRPDAPASTPAPTPKKDGPTKKSAPKRVTAASGKDEDLDLSTPDKLKAYELAILKALKSGKHVDDESGISSTHLRAIVGGSTPQARGVLDALIAEERVAFYGKARGTKYYIFT